MDAPTVGIRLVELARANEDLKAVEELYAAYVVSVEIMSGANEEPQIGEGIETIYEKLAWWERVAEVHSLDVEGPFAGNGDDHLVVPYSMDVTMEGQRSQLNEVGLYTVADGKIVKEVYLGLVG